MGMPPLLLFCYSWSVLIIVPQFIFCQALRVGLFLPRDNRPPFEQWLLRTGIKVVVRPPFEQGNPTRRTILYDYEPSPAPLGEKYAVVDEAHGYYIVPEEESVCFVSEECRGIFAYIISSLWRVLTLRLLFRRSPCSTPATYYPAQYRGHCHS